MSFSFPKNTLRSPKSVFVYNVFHLWKLKKSSIFGMTSNCRRFARLAIAEDDFWPRNNTCQFHRPAVARKGPPVPTNGTNRGHGKVEIVEARQTRDVPTGPESLKKSI